MDGNPEWMSRDQKLAHLQKLETEAVTHLLTYEGVTDETLASDKLRDASLEAMFDLAPRIRRVRKQLGLSTSFGPPAVEVKPESTTEALGIYGRKPTKPARVPGGRHCGWCGKPGHYAKSCPENPANAGAAADG